VQSPLHCFYGGYRCGRVTAGEVNVDDSQVLSRFGVDPMRCEYCRARAGLLRRVCSTCTKVVAVIDRSGGEVGLAQLVDLFANEGLSRDQVDRVLDAEIGNRPTIRDRLTSNMVNALMRGLGMPGRQSPEDVQKVRSAVASGQGSNDTEAVHAAARQLRNGAHDRVSGGQR
jgi:hypothetical protein